MFLLWSSCVAQKWRVTEEPTCGGLNRWGLIFCHITKSWQWVLVGTHWHLLANLLAFSWPLPHGCKMVAGAFTIMSTYQAGRSRDKMTPSSSANFYIRQSKIFPRNHPPSFYLHLMARNTCMATSSSERAWESISRF